MRMSRNTCRCALNQVSTFGGEDQVNMKKQLKLDNGTILIDLSPFGFERYVYNGDLLLKRWSYKFNQDVLLEIDGKTLLIEFRSGFKSGCHAKATYGGVVLAENIFDELINKVGIFSNKMERSNKIIRPVSIALIAIAVALHVYVTFFK